MDRIVVIRRILLAIALLIFGGAANAQIKREADIDSRLARIALRFYLAQGGANACGPSCSKWIAVEGEFDKGSAARLASFIKQNNLADLPIFFHSTGGLADEGMALGRELRSLGMRAGVARTEKNCSPSDKQCGTRPVDAVPASWRSETARCNSACAFALAGAKERWVPEKSAVGVHSPAYFCFSDKTGQVVRPTGNSKDAVDCRKKIAEREETVRSFVNEMGISPDILDLIKKVPNSQMRYLTREELGRFRIATGEFKN
jgi:hypothetical protein